MLARGVAQMRFSGTMPSTSVHAELQIPSMITRSLRSRTFAYFALYCSTKPPKSRVTCKSANAGPHQSNARIKHTIRIGRPQLPASCVGRANIRLTALAREPFRGADLGETEAGKRQTQQLVAMALSVATPGGLEPPTFSLEGCCSIQLSYGAVCPIVPPSSLAAQ